MAMTQEQLRELAARRIGGVGYTRGLRKRIRPGIPRNGQYPGGGIQNPRPRPRPGGPIRPPITPRPPRGGGGQLNPMPRPKPRPGGIYTNPFIPGPRKGGPMKGSDWRGNIQPIPRKGPGPILRKQPGPRGNVITPGGRPHILGKSPGK
jgi:hypothetical protein